MNYPPEHAANILRIAQKIMDEDKCPSDKLPNMWRTVASIYAISLARAVREKIGDSVYSGPFKGMKLHPSALDGMFGPRLLGCYEHELHRIMEQVVAAPYHTILNIGCSIGYYAVGLALRMPQITIRAFDIEADMQQACRELTALNGVGDRVLVGGEFNGEDFARYVGPGTLLLMDIEGAEKDLLDPVRWPALLAMDVIVELHDCNLPGISKTITDRFKATHTIEIVPNRSTQFPLETIFGETICLDHFDNTIITFEGRSGPTPWAVMRRKS